jgi:hypothetical protein
LVKQSPSGRELARREIRNLLFALIDIVIQFSCRRRERCIEEIWYEPAFKRRGMQSLE